MPRVKRGTMHAKRRRNLLKAAKGFKFGRKKLIKLTKQAIVKSLTHAFVDRRRKKREFRNLWNIQINAASRLHGLSYSQFINKLKTHNVALNRKILATLGREHPNVFSKLIEKIKK